MLCFSPGGVPGHVVGREQGCCSTPCGGGGESPAASCRCAVGETLGVWPQVRGWNQVWDSYVHGVLRRESLFYKHITCIYIEFQWVW